MTIDRISMTEWVIEALKNLGGSGTILEISKEVWESHGEEIKDSGDSFYNWQYEIRWAGDILRKDGILRPTDESERGKWELAQLD